MSEQEIKAILDAFEEGKGRGVIVIPNT